MERLAAVARHVGASACTAAPAGAATANLDSHLGRDRIRALPPRARRPERGFGPTPPGAAHSTGAPDVAAAVTLTPEEMDFYRESGFIYVPGVVDRRAIYISD
jgi:hypothetical protein